MKTDFRPNILQNIAILGYSLLWLLIIPLTIIHYALNAMRGRQGYSLARLSRYGICHKKAPKRGLLVHCASVGEVVAIQGLIEKLLSQNPSQSVIITTNTTTGEDRVKLLFSDKVTHFYLPYDFPLFTWLFLKKLRPTKILINEMELWPNLCHISWKMNIPIFIVNGRMSEKSTKTYQKLPALFIPMLKKIAAICVQGERDYTNYLSLGAEPEKLVLTNNIKFDLKMSDKDITTSEVIYQSYGLNGRTLLVAGSTHDPEEQVILDAYLTLAKVYPNILLVIVPRHPQRFEKVYQLLQKQGIDVNLMSKGKPIQADTQVLLCDQMGKLRAIYALADIAFVGGSIADRGGHNALEPAAFGVPILMGPSTHNNPAICQALSTSGALKEVTGASQIISYCEQWLVSDTIRIQTGNAGKLVLSQNSGAIEKTLEVLS